MDKERRTNIIAGFLNILNAVLMLTLCLTKYNEFGAAILIYFTILSNVIGGLSSLLIGITEFLGRKPRAALVLKQIGTAALTLTFATVMLYLGPRFGYGRNLAGTELFLHLACPLLALLTYLFLDPVNEKELNILENLYGIIPMAIYAVFYYTQAFVSKRIPDIYAFARGGELAANAVLMFAVAVAISLLIWFIRDLASRMRTKR